MDIFITTVGIYGALVLILVTCAFSIAQIKQNNAIMDVCYGMIYVLATLGTIILTDVTTSLVWIVFILLLTWGLRLSLRIGRKNWGRPEDQRYAVWRKDWLKRSPQYFLIRSYLQIYLLQGSIITIVSLPIIVIITANSPLIPTTTYIGLCIMFFGLIYETIADWQLDNFLKSKRLGVTEEQIMKRGLFQYSRRPNYFGEACIWWGFALAGLFMPFGFLGLLGPLLITYILTCVTGPMLEKIFLEKYPEKYTKYKNETNYFVPGPPKNA